MRILLPCFVLCIIATGQRAAFAQVRSPFNYETTRVNKKGTPRIPRLGGKRGDAAELIQKRAQEQGRQRRARIALRHWQGRSLLRPNMKTLHGGYIPGWPAPWWKSAAATLRMQW